jgi:hypothetical protein
MALTDPPTATLRGVTIVVPTVGRSSLQALLDGLAAGSLLPEEVLLVDDRGSAAAGPLGVSELPAALASRVRVLTGPGRGPAAARNVGWRAARPGGWVAFLDDDVVPGPSWAAQLAEDLAGLPDGVVGSQGRIRVPLPSDRAPTDWERTTKGLEDARWATADMAYRHAALAAVGGFDERFPRAYREDADLGLRVTAAGGTIVAGSRVVTHPVRPADPLVSLRLQAGNADDPVMRALHGADWRARAGVAPGRRPRHLAVTAAAAGALAAVLTGRRRAARLLAGAWALGTAELAHARIAPGPRTAREVLTMLGTSAVLPPLAAWHWARGVARARRMVAA